MSTITQPLIHLGSLLAAGKDWRKGPQPACGAQGVHREQITPHVWLATCDACKNVQIDAD